MGENMDGTQEQVVVYGPYTTKDGKLLDVAVSSEQGSGGNWITLQQLPNGGDVSAEVYPLDPSKGFKPPFSPAHVLVKTVDGGRTTIPPGSEFVIRKGQVFVLNLL